jgi:hypothetical protein
MSVIQITLFYTKIKIIYIFVLIYTTCTIEIHKIYVIVKYFYIFLLNNHVHINTFEN